MPRLIRNAVRCLQCGEVVDSKNTHDYVVCRCGNIAVDGGPSYERIVGRALIDASYEPMHEYVDGYSVAGSQFLPFLDGRFTWDSGDGWALHRMLASLVTGTVPDLERLGVAGLRRLGYLAEIAISMSPEPAPEKALRALIVELRERVRLEPMVGEAIDPGWLPGRLAGVDEQAQSWGLAIGLSEEFRNILKTRIE